MLKEKPRKKSRERSNHLEEHGETQFLAEAKTYLEEMGMESLAESPKTAEDRVPGCPAGKFRDLFADTHSGESETEETEPPLSQWPVQLHLIPAGAPWLQNKDLLLCADCVGYAVGDFHRRYLNGKALAIACPKLDTGQDVYLQKLITDPDSEITDIARQISMDPSLTADLLKVVNSAQFMLPKRVDNIVEAVKLVGLRGIRNLLYSYGTQKLLQGQQSWRDHSYLTAFYAYNLAKSLRKKDILDDAYVGGILHDMGKIVFSDVHPQLLEKINNFCKDGFINMPFMEFLC